MINRLESQNIHELNNSFNLSLKRLSDFIQFFRYLLEDIQNQEKTAFLEARQDHQYKFINFVINNKVGGKVHTVIELRGIEETSEFISEYVAFRYGSIQDRIADKEMKIEQLRELARLKNPYLLKQFKPF